jgi:hypothetical protein
MKKRVVEQLREFPSIGVAESRLEPYYIFTSLAFHPLSKDKIRRELF